MDFKNLAMAVTDVTIRQELESSFTDQEVQAFNKFVGEYEKRLDSPYEKKDN